MEEIWKPIEGYEDYEISNYGRVKSLKYGKEKIKSLWIKKKGYRNIVLYKDGKGKSELVHRLVAQAFIPNPDNLPFINHKDENPSNNHVDNLEWCTNYYNSNYGSRNQKIAEKNSKRVLQYSLDGEFIREWESESEIQRQLGYWRTNISRCCKGECKKNKSYNYVWKFAK